MDRILYKSILLHTMKDFISLCEENKLKYVAAFGTVLGAVRHNGLIPWDDDIDVYMPREDYNKLLTLKNKLKGTKYELQDYCDEGYYLPYAKFCNKNTTLWELEEFPHIIGVFIDIFPLDKCSRNIEVVKDMHKEYRKAWFRYLNCLFVPPKEKILISIYGFKLRTILTYLKCYISKYFLKRKLLNDFKKRENTISEFKGECYIYYDVYINENIDKLIYPPEWIENNILFKFEDFNIKLPEQFHEYLSQEYGDYMQLPPIEGRKSQHFCHFVDLKKRLQIKDLKSN